MHGNQSACCKAHIEQTTGVCGGKAAGANQSKTKLNHRYGCFWHRGAYRITHHRSHHLFASLRSRIFTHARTSLHATCSKISGLWRQECCCTRSWLTLIRLEMITCGMETWQTGQYLKYERKTSK